MNEKSGQESAPLEYHSDSFPDVTFYWRDEQTEAESGGETTVLYCGTPVQGAYWCDLNGDGSPELCSTVSFGFGLIDSRVIVYDVVAGRHYEIEDRGVYDYTLKTDGDALVIEKRDCYTLELIAVGRPVYTDGAVRFVS